MKVNFIVFLMIFTLSSFPTIYGSLISDFLNGAKSFWPKGKDLSSVNHLKKLPAVQFELPAENNEFLKEGLEILKLPKESQNLCGHRIISNLKKNCNQLTLDEIGKLAVMLMNCQLESEGRQIYSCKPEMTLEQCTMGFDKNIYEIYTLMTHRTLAVCQALKHDQFRALTEMTIDRLMKTTQGQTTAVLEALQNQKRVNEMTLQNYEELRDHHFKIKEAQIQNLEALSTAKEQINEINSDLQRQFEIHQLSKEKLLNIEKSANDISHQLDSTNEKIMLHYSEALKFLEGFRSIMEMISKVTSTIEQTFNKIANVMLDIGIEITKEFFICSSLNVIYFTCGMIYIIFMDLKSKWKKILIGLFIFNIFASYFKSEISLMATNIFIWSLFFCFDYVSAFKRKVFSIEFNFWRKIKPRRLSNDDSSDEDSYDDRKKKGLSRGRSKTPFDNYKNDKKISTPIKNNKTKSKINGHNDNDITGDDKEMADFFENELLKSENLKGPSSIPIRSETPINRPMTPAMMRVMKTDSSVSLERPATPFTTGMSGRTQCVSTTVKGARCRNAAIYQLTKCRVHNYD